MPSLLFFFVIEGAVHLEHVYVQETKTVLFSCLLKAFFSCEICVIWGNKHRIRILPVKTVVICHLFEADLWLNIIFFLVSLGKKKMFKKLSLCFSLNGADKFLCCNFKEI